MNTFNKVNTKRKRQGTGGQLMSKQITKEDAVKLAQIANKVSKKNGVKKLPKHHK